MDKGYLKTLLFGVAEDAECTRLIEVCRAHRHFGTQDIAPQVYKFNFVYSTGGMVSMNIAGPQGETQLLQLNKVRHTRTAPGTATPPRTWVWPTCRSR